MVGAMTSFLRLVAATFLLLLATLGSGAAAQSVDAFSQLPDISYPRLSPDGRYLAAIQPLNGKPSAAIYDLSKPGSPPTVVPSNEWLIDDIRWVKADRLVIFLKQGVKAQDDDMLRTWGRAIVVSPQGENLIILFSDNQWARFNVGLQIQDVAISDPDFIYMPLLVFNEMRGEARSELYKVNVRTGAEERIAKGNSNTRAWVTDGNGKVIARIDQTDRPLVQHLMLLQGDGDWTEIGSYPADSGKGSGILGITEDGTAFVKGAISGGRRVIARMSFDGSNTQVLFQHPQYDISQAITDEWTDRVVGAGFISDQAEATYFDPNRQKLQRALEKAFPGLSVRAVSWSLDLTKVVVHVEGATSPPAFYLVDRTKGTADLVGGTYPGIEPDQLGDMQAWHYKARDGLDIPAYLTLPPGRAPKNLPLIVMPHGGPDLRDFMNFDWWSQFLASRGYAVLQPNYRGSWGYGTAFTEAGLQEWGLKMQDDISDGVKKAIADGIADPKRVCIVGASYGGYAALAGATLTPDLYACAVSVAGVSDLPAMIAHERRRWGKRSSVASFWISRIGSPDDDSERLRATSPARLAANVVAPVLLMHGDLDTTVPFDQSKRMAEALEIEGKAVTLIKLAGDDHELALASTRRQMLTELEKFLAANIGR